MALLIFTIGFCSIGYTQEKLDSLRSALANAGSDSSKAHLLVWMANELTSNRNITEANIREAISLAQEALSIPEIESYDSLKGRALEQLAYAYDQSGQYDSATVFYRKASVIYKKSNLKGRLAEVYNQMGIAKAIRGDNDSAVYYFEAAKELRTQINDSLGVAGSLNNLGIMLYRSGENLRAIDRYMESIQIMDQIDNKHGMVEVMTNIGLIHTDRKDYEQAKLYYHQAEKLALEIKSKPDLAILYNNLGTLYDKLLLPDSALYFQKQSFKWYEEIGDSCGITYPIIEIGNLLLKNQEAENAEEYFKNGLEKSKRCGIKQNIFIATLGLGKIARLKNDLKLAEKYYREALQSAEKMNFIELVKDARYELYLFYKSVGEDSKALINLEKYNILSDSLYTEELTNQSARLEAEYTFKREKQELEHQSELREMALQDEITLQKSRKSLLIISLILVLAVVLILWRLYLLKKRSNNQLLRLNEEIKAQKEEITQQRDILETSQQELIRLNEEKNELIGIVAHDLRSPLNQIKGMIHLIQIEDEPLSDDQKDYLNRILDASQRLTDMIGNILDLQAIENHKLNLKTEPVDIAKIIDKLITNIKVLADRKGIILVKEITPLTIIAIADGNYLIQVFENLISNAIKFSNHHKQVIIGAKIITDDFVQVYIKDQGPGISDDNMKRLFHRFERLGNNPTGGEKSTGLGLSIAKKYIEAMNGKIYCTSKVGEGTTFYVELPGTPVEQHI